MQLSSTPKQTVWTFPDGAAIPYRYAQSLDIEIAENMAAQYAIDVLSAAPLMSDFGFTAESIQSVVEQMAKGEDDTRAFATHFFAVALAERLMGEPVGFEIDGQAATLTRKFLSVLFKDPATQAKWLRDSHTPLHEAGLAGNASAAALLTGSAAAPKTARAAKPLASPAQAAD